MRELGVYLLYNEDLVIEIYREGNFFAGFLQERI